MNTKSEILSMLRAVDGYLSDQQPCDRMGASHIAVWKAINELKEGGYKIETARNRGYHLVESMDVITQAELQSVLHSKWIGDRPEYFNETDSTNTRTRKLAEEGAIHGTPVVTNSQWTGKGRRGRLWTSPEGMGIWMSMILWSAISPLYASMLTLIAGMAVVKGVRSSTGLNIMTKWPNDAVLEGKKICGILAETNTEDGHVRYMITGIGVNVNTDEFPDKLAETVTPLKLEKGESIRRSPAVGAVAEAFEEYYDIFLETCDMSILRGEYNRELADTNREVMVFNPKGQYEGIALGIDNEEGLLAKKKDGTVASVISGGVSMRGTHGYV